jgi:hypothetical protein
VLFGSATIVSIRSYRVLLLLDSGHTVRGTAIAVGGYPREISRVAQRYLQAGLQHALSEDARLKPDRRLDRNQEAAVVALVCAPSPKGQRRWSTRLIAEEVCRRGIVDKIGREAIRLMLAGRKLKPWREKNVVRAGDRPGVRAPDGERAETARPPASRE